MEPQKGVPSKMDLTSNVVGKNKNRGRSQEGKRKQKQRRNRYKLKNSTQFVNVPSTEDKMDQMEEPIGDGDPLKMELMPSTSADDNSHEADVVADESFIVDIQIQPPIEKRVTARMMTLLRMHLKRIL
ncbi:hypothetical protein OUZ56_009356 [Daphnia magna]|uniref:Uncharacterized protein n=1 Tax=Daphnia magna TaxID=35525 RepID=A0ABR0AFW6_9CRUS|nr:hypothetical protein OUZ56_009356 [Daphnia magna]